MSLSDLAGTLPAYITTRYDDPILELYKPCLGKSSRYVRGVAYFRSSIFSLMTDDIISFCIRGGRMEILTSPSIDPDDHRAVIEGYGLADVYDTLEEMLEDEESAHHTKLLCAMVATGHLSIRIALVKNGIYHDKIGYFEDDDPNPNTVSFSGSGNESLSAMTGKMGGNIETYNIMPSWHPHWQEYGARWKRELDSDISGRTGLEIIEFSEIDKAFLEKHEIDTRLEEYLEKPDQEETLETPTEITLRPYQSDALSLWRENGSRGILRHATGSGKTITALKAVESHISKDGPAVIIVPTLALLEQWTGELESRLPNVTLGRIGGGSKDYDLFRHKSTSEDPWVMITTINSIKSEKGVRYLSRLIGSQSTLLVVDECHNVGSLACVELCELAPQKSLGLSATPERYGDQEGTTRVISLLGPVIHEFTMRDALDSGFLTPYDYHFFTTRLTSDEQREYDKLSKEISKKYAIAKSKEGIDKKILLESVKILVFKARRIVRGASGKIEVLKEILEKNYQEGSHWLVYCDNTKMLEKADLSIRNTTKNIIPKVYHSKMDDFSLRKTLREFEREGGLLLAMKCLDEGVNVPRISHGLVLSSTTNPREFIQRRGRMLRKSPGKEKAHIFDAFALPDSTQSGSGFILSEIERAEQMAENSLNRMTNVVKIGSIKRAYGVTTDNQFEEEDDRLD